MANVMRMRRTTAGPPTARAPMARAKVEGFDPKKAKQPLEIGSQAVWSVSSSKPGYGVSHLRDGSTETYWQ